MAASVLRNVGVVSLVTLGQLILQFALQMVLAHRFGAGAEIDAFNAALTIPNVLNAVLTVSLGYVLIPQLARLFSNPEDEEAAWQLAATVGGWITVIALIISASLFFFARQWIEFLYPGFDADTSTLAVRSLQWLSWQLVLGTTVSWVQSVENSRHRFAWPAIMALVGALINLGLAMAWVQSGILGYAQSIIASSVIHAVVLIAPIVGRLLSAARVWHPRMKSLVWQWLPLLVGGIYLRLDPLFDRVFGSFMTEGSIAHLGYSQRFITALLTLSTGGILTVLFPKLSSNDDASDQHALRDKLQRSLYGMLVVLTPIVIGGSLFAVPVTRDLLERGEFLPSDTRAVAELFQILLLFLAAASIADLIARGFYTIGDTRTPTLIGTIGVTVGLVLKYFLSKSFGVQGIVWANSIYYVAVTLVLTWLLSRRIGPLLPPNLGRQLFKPILASCIACCLAYVVIALGGRYSSLPAAIIAAAAYPAILLLVREPLAVETAMRLREKNKSKP
jgi:putative peptidoglycan lipid II flippase